MSIESEAVKDQQIVESRFSRALSMVGRIGGTALVGYAGYLFARNGVSVSEVALAAPGVGLMAAGVRLGTERGAARERIDQRAQFGGQVVVGVTEERKIGPEPTLISRLGTTTGPLVELGLAGLLGMEIGITGNSSYGALPLPFEAGTAATVVLVVAATEYAVEKAGRTIEAQPHLHDVLHIG
jgi:hypothetical protein